LKQYARKRLRLREQSDRYRHQH